jgi:GNAT superfamily N-acetyltransferase
MQLNIATVSDLPKIAPIAKEFFLASQFLRRFELDRFVQVWTSLIESGTGVIFATEDHSGEWSGAIGGMIYPDLYSGVLVATEFFWFVREGHRGQGIKLYKAFEAWARERECSEIRMVHLMDSMPDKLERFYRHYGYVPAEQLYTKELKS